MKLSRYRGLGWIYALINTRKNNNYKEIAKKNSPASTKIKIVKVKFNKMYFSYGCCVLVI